MTPGKSWASFDAQVVDVFGGGMMILGKLDENIGVAGADRRGIAVGKIDAAVGQADVVDNADQFGLRNLLANVGFHAIAERGGFFDARAGGSAHVQLEFAAIHGREKVLAEQRKQREGKHAGSQETDGEEHAVVDAALEQRGGSARASRSK